jgi:NAD(P)-dependent dehydrogenase (short-subunit alcohol dehydrogenase family)
MTPFGDKRKPCRNNSFRNSHLPIEFPLLAGGLVFNQNHYVNVPEELGATGTFLASDGAAAITGQVLYVDCGYEIMGM